jgi:hypothetical protein
VRECDEVFGQVRYTFRAMNASAAAKILLVRAVEERAPELLPPDAVAEAGLEAGPVADESGWFARRAELLLEHLPVSLAGLLGMPRAMHGGLVVYLLAAVALGLATNYLGPARAIHAVYNPIVLLVLWNLAVYVALVTGSPASRRLRSWRAPRPRAGGSEAAPSPTRRRGRSVFRWCLRRSIPVLWLRVQRAAAETREEAARLGPVAKRFWELWGEAARPLFGVAARRIASVCALGLATGAVLGMFVRGLFLDYHVVWRSTFLTDPATVGAILKTVFALPALVAGQAVPGAEEARLLLGAGGVPAAHWITLYAAAAVVFIGIPRLAMIAFQTAHLRVLESRLRLLDDPYFEEAIRPAREQRVDEIGGAIRTDVRVETGRFAEGIATWVCERLYDDGIVPILRGFREHGGRMRDLGGRITARCEAFRPELDARFDQALEELHRSLSRSVARTVGADVKFQPSVATGLQDEVLGTSRGVARGGGDSLVRDLELLTVSGVSGAIALVAGSLSGGFGHSLGTAVLVGLLGTSGPVGFLLGALLGLVAAGGAYLLGRDRAGAALASVKLPGPVVRAALRPGRFDQLVRDGRRRCHDSVAGSLRERLDPLTEEISEQIWRQVKPVLVERQRA